MIRSTICVFALAVACLVLGCSDGGNAVITPGEDYQLTEQEQANLATEEAMRKQ